MTFPKAGRWFLTSRCLPTPALLVFVRTGHGTRWYTETSTFYDGAPGIGLECARWFSG